jgi:hypothetical protein
LEKKKDNPYVSSETCAAITAGLNKRVDEERILTDEKIKSVVGKIQAVGAAMTIILGAVGIADIVMRYWRP